MHTASVFRYKPGRHSSATATSFKSFKSRKPARRFSRGTRGKWYRTTYCAVSIIWREKAVLIPPPPQSPNLTPAG